MTEEKKTEGKSLDSNKNVMIAVGVVVLVFVAFFVYKSTQKETVSMSIGGKEISATFEK